MDFIDIETISVPDPDGLGMPLYDGDPEGVRFALEDGVYENVVATSEEDGDLVDTVGTLTISDGFSTFEG